MSLVNKTLNFPSQAEANKMIRVLSGKPKKYTVTVHLPDGRCIEFQHEYKPAIKFFDEDRCLWVMVGQYNATEPVMKFPDGAILMVEENPPEVKG